MAVKKTTSTSRAAAKIANAIKAEPAKAAKTAAKAVKEEEKTAVKAEEKAEVKASEKAPVKADKSGSFGRYTGDRREGSCKKISKSSGKGREKSAGEKGGI